MVQIRLEDVTKSYPMGRIMMPAVMDINLTINPGDFLFVIGSSGAGKSTLLKLITGEMNPTSGAVHLGKAKITKYTPKMWKKRLPTIGVVGQTPEFVRQKTINENLEFAAMFSQRKNKDSTPEERIAKALRMVGLPDIGDKYPGEITLGESRRVELARAIMANPTILILDELTANLDEDTQWDMLYLLGEFNKRGTTIVMATHAKQYVNIMRQRVITLVDGKIFSDVKNGTYGGK